ncbi:GntR family transcriptional regulator [Azorhizobium oxalatiphilum]|uniref:GntR family transcriptional regulator n=1 Tax=Azorhizobium oxalatiphilum TaxID=980631 RepID=A0A917FBU6_9HYPH|nr:GntR family transcriptional regulator [Azorhizobium oxalatiphilum]GGF63132.1 GntR family transcriptional regulator [Azorhizobium oxalatiphilum]
MTSTADEVKIAPRLTEVAYRQLLDMILSGQLEAGSVVQERKLAKALDVSRTPLRDALFRLEGEGLLIRRGEGALQVKTVTLEDYSHALRVRVTLEREAARLAAGHVPANVLAPLRARIVQLVKAAEAAGGELPGRDDLDAVDELLHEAIAEGSGNPLMADLIRQVRQRSRLFGLERRPGRIREICAEHLEIIDALAAGKGDEACTAMERHLGRVIEDLKQRVFDPRG